MAEKTRIISVMPHGPAYGYYKGARPEVAWDKPDGGVVGFWPREWMDLLGAEILKNTDGYSWEVWQPDLRADKVYAHTLSSGVTHKIFPAEEREFPSWPYPGKYLDSPALISSLRDSGAERTVILLYGTYGFRLPFYVELLNSLKGLSVPVFMRSGGMFKAPLSELKELHRPSTYLRAIKENSLIGEALSRADAVSEQSSSALKELRKIYSGRVEKLTLGCDFDFWRPPSAAEKTETRRRLGIPEGNKVFFASGNFVPRKQLDRLSASFVQLGKRDDFFLLIAGHGTEEESARLSGITAPLVEKGRARIHPYAQAESLRDLYWAADVYVSVATDEGGPASVMKALACGIPVFSTPVGETADALKADSCGRLVPVREYGTWTSAIADILNGNMPRPMDMTAARERYHWPDVAARYLKLFDELIREYYGS